MLSVGGVSKGVLDHELYDSGWPLMATADQVFVFDDLLHIEVFLIQDNPDDVDVDGLK